MRRYWVGLVVLVGLLAWAAPGQAQVFIRAPFVRVAVGPPPWMGGPGVYVRTPFVTVNTGAPVPVLIGPNGTIGGPYPPYVVSPPAVQVPTPAPAQAPEVLGTPTPVPSPPPAPSGSTAEPQATLAPQAPALVPNQALTVEQFAQSFKPAAGRYQVTLLHPRTKSPVTVAFTLPEGTPRVRVTNRALEFDYGRQEVDIRFLLGGRVEVSYLD